MERLYRSQTNRVIAGVAGGLAEYFRVDVVLVRLLWVLSIFLGGGGLFVYIVAWIIIPDEQSVFAGPGKQTEGTETDDATGGTWGSGGEQTQAETQWKAADKREWHNEEGKAGMRRRHSAGLLLVGLGIIFLAYQLFGPLFRFAWPLLLVALGIYLLARERKGGAQ